MAARSASGRSTSWFDSTTTGSPSSFPARWSRTSASKHCGSLVTRIAKRLRGRRADPGDDDGGRADEAAFVETPPRTGVALLRRRERRLDLGRVAAENQHGFDRRSQLRRIATDRGAFGREPLALLRQPAE